MTIELTGVVENGVIKLDKAESLPEGATVKVLVTSPQSTIWDKLSTLAGTVTDLPPDLAAEHDHYAHGAPRRAPEKRDA